MSCYIAHYFIYKMFWKSKTIGRQQIGGHQGLGEGLSIKKQPEGILEDYGTVLYVDCSGVYTTAPKLIDVYNEGMNFTVCNQKRKWEHEICSKDTGRLDTGKKTKRMILRSLGIKGKEELGCSSWRRKWSRSLKRVGKTDALRL